MSAITAAIYDVLSSDTLLAAMLATYGGELAVFTIDPPPADATLPYIIISGESVQRPFDTKLLRGRELWCDVRCYTARSGSAKLVDDIAERARALLHRQTIAVEGFTVEIVECNGPISVNEQDCYGRIVTARIIMMEG